MTGMIERGEQPEDSIRREIEEELGYRADCIEHVATFYVSPGGSSERIWMYYAEVSAAGRVSAGGGLPGEHEDIRVLAMSPQEARAALKDGRMADAKTIIGLQWLSRQRICSKRNSWNRRLSPCWKWTTFGRAS
jgi:nudix-type nucleoside diphosphatase (YffH/AdpP family)